MTRPASSYPFPNCRFFPESCCYPAGGECGNLCTDIPLGEPAERPPVLIPVRRVRAGGPPPSYPLPPPEAVAPLPAGRRGVDDEDFLSRSERIVFFVLLGVVVGLLAFLLLQLLPSVR